MIATVIIVMPTTNSIIGRIRILSLSLLVSMLADGSELLANVQATLRVSRH